MKYIIMCGRSYAGTDLPKQLFKIGATTIVDRTISLLRKHGVTDICISTNDNRFEQCGVPILRHENTGAWINGFYPTDEPTCYIFGDVVFSERAVATIVKTQTDTVEFFASAPPFAPEYPKQWAEPFAFKVVDTELFKNCISRVRDGIAKQLWHREPIAWELWQVIKNTEPNKIVYSNYVAINDYTCDVDYVKDLDYYENNKDMLRIGVENNTKYLIHAMPKRMWYVEKFLIPSMVAQGIDRDNISVYNDSNHLGNLKACMYAFKTVSDDFNGTWHLQDDVIISHDFKEKTELYDDGIVCGFNSMYDGDNPCGHVSVSKMWFSFPCIRIPNKIALDCAEWCLTYMINNPVYREYWEKGVNDDWMFRNFVKDYYKDEKVLNLAPNIVDHIDYLIGGTVNSDSQRLVQIRSRCWRDEPLVEELKQKLRS